MKAIKSAFIIALIAVPAVAFAQNGGGAVGGAVGGAAAGAVVGGPVGAVVGGAAGAVVGSSLPPQPSVVYQGQVVVDQPLPDTVTVYPVPDSDAYSYTVVNNRKVIVDRKSRKIVRVIE